MAFYPRLNDNLYASLDPFPLYSSVKISEQKKKGVL